MEIALAWLYRGHVVTAYDQQVFGDIDIEVPEPEPLAGTYSVKQQATAWYTGNLSFEIRLSSSYGLGERPGNFCSCKAKFYLIAHPLNEEHTLWRALRFEHATLLPWVLDPQWEERPLSKRIEGTNAGRYWNKADSKIIPIDWCEDQALGFKEVNWTALCADVKFLEFHQASRARITESMKQTRQPVA